MTFDLVSAGPLPRALPDITEDQWCHLECFKKWSTLDWEIKTFIGGHIHFDVEDQQWNVPFYVPLKLITN